MRALVEAHRDKVQAALGSPVPLQKIVLGCTHFPLAAAGAWMRPSRPCASNRTLHPWIASRRELQSTQRSGRRRDC